MTADKNVGQKWVKMNYFYYSEDIIKKLIFSFRENHRRENRSKNICY